MISFKEAIYALTLKFTCAGSSSIGLWGIGIRWQ